MTLSSGTTFGPYEILTQLGEGGMGEGWEARALKGPPPVTQAAEYAKQIPGTLQYMAPERLHGKTAGARSDIFAFGCVLYEMLPGKRAFEGEWAASVIAAALEAAPPLDRVIRRRLAKEAGDRFQTARDLNFNLALATEPQADGKPRQSGARCTGWRQGWRSSSLRTASATNLPRFSSRRSI